MAELKKAVLGEVSGALGDIVFRERHGLNYLATRPSSFMPGTDVASINRRARFALTGKTSQSVNRIPVLKLLWAKAYSNGMSPYNYIFKTNYRFITASTITDLLKIVPDNGFGVMISDSNVDRTRVRVMTDAIGSNAGIDPLIESNIMSACVIFLSSPVDESVGAYSIISLVSPLQATKIDEPLTFDANLNNQQQVIFDKYQNQKTFVALVTIDAAGVPVHYSSTSLLA
jgi:hypothetical protein